MSTKIGLSVLGTTFTSIFFLNGESFNFLCAFKLFSVTMLKSFTPFLTLLISLLFLLGCESSIIIDPNTGFEVFTIQKGNQNSVIRNEDFSAKGIEVTVIFNESAIYTLEDSNDQADINKLIGFSDCDRFHQLESARIGWRWYNDEMQILTYVYNNGDLSFELMGAIPLNTPVDLSIEIQDNQYVFKGDQLTTQTIPRASNCADGVNYWLLPFFGGNQSAPQEMTIQLKRAIIE